MTRDQWGPSGLKDPRDRKACLGLKDLRVCAVAPDQRAKTDRLVPAANPDFRERLATWVLEVRKVTGEGAGRRVTVARWGWLGLRATWAKRGSEDPKVHQDRKVGKEIW